MIKAIPRAMIKAIWLKFKEMCAKVGITANYTMFEVGVPKKMIKQWSTDWS